MFASPFLFYMKRLINFENIKSKTPKKAASAKDIMITIMV
jgi:hypothetical protein